MRGGEGLELRGLSQISRSSCLLGSHHHSLHGQLPGIFFSSEVTPGKAGRACGEVMMMMMMKEEEELFLDSTKPVW